MELVLTRYAYLPDCTLGRLIVAGTQLMTIERPWLDNRRNVSCIPEGEYTVAHYSSKRFISALEVEDVPGRSSILIHVGNYAEDVAGCIAVGIGFQVYQRRCMVTQSKLAMELLMRATKGEELTLEIKHYEARL